MGFRQGFKAEANRIALRIREKLGLPPHAPIDPWAVAAHFEVEIIPLSQLGADCSHFLGPASSTFSAVIVPCGSQTAIVHNDSHHPHRQASNICHELAHLFLGHETTPPLTDDGDRHHDSDIEAEANFLAGCLLLTNEGANHVLKHGLASQAGHTYGISQTMLDYRLRISGATTIHRRRSAAA